MLVFSLVFQDNHGIGFGRCSPGTFNLCDENFQNNLNGVNSFIRKSKKGPRGALCIPYLTKCQEEQPMQFFSWSISFYPSSQHIALHKHTYKANLKAAGHDVPVTCLKFNVCWYLSNNISLWNWWFDKKKLNKCRGKVLRVSENVALHWQLT